MYSWVKSMWFTKFPRNRNTSSRLKAKKYNKMCQNGNFRNSHAGQGSKSWFSTINILHDLPCPSFARPYIKNFKIIELWLRFLTLPHTHWECQSVHKTHDFEWNDPTVPDWASRCVRKTHSHYYNSSLWYPVTLASFSTPLQQGRKRGEENCRSEVRGQIISRDLAGRKRKTGWKFWKTPPT